MHSKKQLIGYREKSGEKPDSFTFTNSRLYKAKISGKCAIGIANVFINFSLFFKITALAGVLADVCYRFVSVHLF